MIQQMYVDFISATKLAHKFKCNHLAPLKKNCIHLPTAYSIHTPIQNHKIQQISIKLL